MPTASHTESTAVEAAVFDAIRMRRNTKRFADREVESELVARIIEVATWAPNHRHTEPWRFVVLPKGSDARAKVAELVHDWTYENVKNPNPERRASSAAEIRDEVMAIPAMVYIYSIPGRDAEMTQENYAAACCAAQNMQLAAHALGLAVGWSTGRTCKCAAVHEVLGAEPEWMVVGAFSIGYACDEQSAERAPVESVATWLD